MKGMTKSDILQCFEKIDQELGKTKHKIQITVLGGLAIILQDFRERSTLDIDIAPTPDAKVFTKICKKLNIPVDIITVASTVDLTNAETLNQFSGKFLRVDSIKAEDLIKSKLERFRKQDPEDIMAIIDKSGLAYQSFKGLVKDMLIDFVGNSKPLILSATEIVERKYSAHLEDFIRLIKKNPYEKT